MNVVRKLMGEYLIFRIYHKDIQPSPTAEPTDPNCREIAQVCTRDPSFRNGYGGYQAIGFKYVENDVDVAFCWFWYGDRYRERNFWPLAEGEAKLVRIETVEAARGRHIAPQLLKYAEDQMARRGFRRLYARIWHSYKPSLRAFERAGWKFKAIVIQFNLLGRTRRFVFDRSAATAARHG